MSVNPRDLVRRAQSAARRDKWGAELDSQLQALGLPAPEREYRFDNRPPGRDVDGKKLPRAWRFDRCWIELRVACEIEGVTYGGGRHQQKAGFEADAAKYLEATRQGWLVVRVTPLQIRLGFALAALEELLQNRTRTHDP